MSKKDIIYIDIDDIPYKVKPYMKDYKLLSKKELDELEKSIYKTLDKLIDKLKKSKNS